MGSDARIDMLPQSVAEMRSALESGPLARLRSLLDAGAARFDQPEGLSGEIADIAVQVGRVVWQARRAVMGAGPRRKQAATPIGLDRHEGAEAFLRVVTDFLDWADEAAGAGADISERRVRLLEGCDRVLHACRSLRRDAMSGRM